ncbi:MAG: MFS transporter [Firmicutes bacterium]|nr:MFS transporter [Bacillota bacterium]
MEPQTLWVIVVGYFAGIAGTFNEFFVPPIVPLFRAHFHLGAAAAGWLMSVFALTTIGAALSGSTIIHRWGAKKVAGGGVAASLLAVGTVQAGYTHRLLAWVLLGRAVGGLGFGWISVAAPVLITASVPAHRHRLAMGVWSTWVPIGSVAMFVAAPRLAVRGQLAPVTLLLAAVMGMSLVLLAATPFASPAAPDATGSAHRAPPSLYRWTVWWIAGSFALFTVQFFGFNTWVTTFLTRHAHMTLAAAGLWAAVGGLATALFNVLGGVWLALALRRRILFYLAPSLILGLIWLALPHLPPAAAVSAVVGVGIFAGGIPTLVFAAPGLAARQPGELAWGMAWIIVGENAGIILGPPLFGTLWARGGFSLAFGVLAAAAGFMALTLSQSLRRLAALIANEDP